MPTEENWINDDNESTMPKPQTIYRFSPAASPGEGFTQISNRLLQDPRISRATKGLIAELLSRPRDWQVTVQGLMASGPEGRDQLRRLIREAEECGLIRKAQGRAADGSFATNAWAVYDAVWSEEAQNYPPTEHQNCDIPTADWKPDDGLSDDGKLATTKKVRTNTGSSNTTETESRSTSYRNKPSRPKSATALSELQDATVEQINAARMVALRVKALDCNGVLASVLFRDESYSALAVLLRQYGGRVEQAALSVLARDRSGRPLRRGHVRSWGYFEPLIVDEDFDDDAPHILEL